MEKVLVLGHRQPDTDSIGSVIGYGALLNHASPGRYVPARCGELSQETTWALETFGVEPPLLVEDVVPRVADLSISRISVAVDVPVADIAALMDTHDIRNVPVTDGRGRLVGMVSEHGLTRYYVCRTQTGDRTITDRTPGALANALSARLLVEGGDAIGGRVFVAIDAPDISGKRPGHHDIAIVGDNEAVQLALLSGGVKGLIVAGGARAGERVMEKAREQGVSLLETDLEVFAIGNRLDLLLPAGMVMETDIPRLSLADTLEHAKRTVFGSRFRAACVVEPDGTLRGIVTRTTLVPDIRRKVILLDHNELSQAVDGVEQAEILEIIDHHRLAVISTLKPVKFLNDPVGSTSTIIAEKFIQAGLEPEPPVAGMLLSGILSDTLNLKASTTTGHDRDAVTFLASIAGIDPFRYGIQLLEQGMNLPGVAMGELLTRDTKQYEIFGKKVIIAQVMVPSPDFVREHEGEIHGDLNRLRVQRGVDLYLGMFTNAMDDASYLFAAGDTALLSRLELGVQPVHLPGMLSRKKDLVPWFGERLRGG
ncbi:MAG TPA: putative manganese-dependent inorganic diphosphatase [Methanoregulaceae archaeon]|nr:MAG: putative manganese-dependent inorganic diphosphatase [Methanolinea sp.]HPD10624.1 putative manganese-dependent inorganic diphosphatase [Methanoregulaceae archaeon]